MDAKLKKLYKKNLAKPDESIYEHTKLVLEGCKILLENEYIDKETSIMLKPACQYHDIGKLNKHFSLRLKNGTKFNPKLEVGHNILSAFLASYYIDLETEKKDIVINAILNHHHYIENYSYINENRSLINTSLEEMNLNLKIDDETFKQKVISSIGNRRIQKLKKNRTTPDYIKVKGLLNKCDYAASAHIDVELKNDFLEDSISKLDYDWNEMQIFCQENKDSNLIVVGSTGLGKTEASLLWSGNSKIFYVLPLRTSINAMYFRIRDKIIIENVEDRLGLLHGDTASIYLQDVNSSDGIANDKVIEEDLKFFDYYDRTKSMSLPITVATPDQLFDFVFKYPAYELKLATFSYSKIIIDEIQAYSPDILAYTIMAIKRINILGGQFALFTATLAPFVRDLLLENHKDEMPIKCKEASFLSRVDRHVLKVIEERISGSYVLQTLENSDVKSGLIIMNTVKEAQAMFDELQNHADKNKYEFNLLHAKFTGRDRKAKETAILKDGDPELREENAKVKIWISTQIVEASLDIDFDILFTELSELLGLFQRMGRCYRKREKTDEVPNIHVFTEINDSYLTSEAGDKGFIDRGLYLLSKEALLEHGNDLINEIDKVNMIETYFTTERIKATSRNNFIYQYEKRYKYIDSLNLEQLDKKEVRKQFRNIVSYKAIPKSVYCSSNVREKTVSDLKDEIDQVYKNIGQNVSDEEKNKLRVRLIKLQDELNEYTLNVEPYLIDFNSFEQIGNEKIYIIKYAYDNELGLQVNKKDNTGIGLW